MTLTITEDALSRAADALEKLSETLFQRLPSAADHQHCWVFLRQDTYQKQITKERIREVVGAPKIAADLITYGTDRYYEVSDFYYCSGCDAMRRVHMEDYFRFTGSLDGTPHIRFWVKEIPANAD